MFDGYEYSAITNLRLSDDYNNRGKRNANNSSLNSQNDDSFRSYHENEPKLKSSKLLSQLKSMNECPDYLIPISSSYSSNAATSFSSLLTSSSSKHCPQHHYTDDFILLSEFSEIEGPKPLLTIPTDGGTGFNKNEYSLHLMCVDFHSHLQTNHSVVNSINNSYSSQPDTGTKGPNSKFSITKDTSIINYWDSNSSVSACVYHFTLYDIEARGFVRPFCIAYISYDKTKPIEFFEEIKENFSKITDLLKKSNFNLFKHDLDQRCSDLKFTKDVFVNWSYDQDADKLNQYRLKIAQEVEMDNKTFARLNASCINEATKKLQLNAIDNLVKELEGVSDIIKTELVSKNWLVDRQIRTNVVNSTNTNYSEIESITKKCSSAVDPLMHTDKNDDFDLIRTNRANTFPTGDQNEPLTIQITDPYTTDKSFSKKKKKKSPYVPFSYLIEEPKLVTSVLVGNLMHLNPTDMEELTSTLMSQPQSTNQPKIMKRLHQLCLDTAKQAINELRLMQRYYSTPYYLLKFKKITTRSYNLRHDKKEDVKLNRKYRNKDLFWSITMGDCFISDFSTFIDMYNLNKYGLIRKTNLENKKKRIESASLDFEKPSLIEKIDSEDKFSAQTSYFTPNNCDFITSDAVATSSLNSNTKIRPSLEKIIKNDDSVDFGKNTSWNSCEKFYDFDQEEDAEIEEEEEFNKIEENSNNDEVFNEIGENKLGEKSQLVLMSNDDDEQFIYEDIDEDDSEVTGTENKNQIKEENEYDFANSLLTVEYKPYNQFSGSFDFNDLYLSSSNMTSSSFAIPSSSLGIFYSTINKYKNQSSITDKLIQISEFNFEETLKKLICNYSNIFPHILYSILKGRPVVCISRYYNDLPYLKSIVDCLSNFVPNSFYCLNSLRTRNNNQTPPKFTSSPCNHTDRESNKFDSGCHNNHKAELRVIHERKPIRLIDLKYSKMFGLSLLMVKEGDTTVHCTPECSNPAFRTNIKEKNHFHVGKNYNDEDQLLTYLPITIRNYVSVFDLDEKTFLGPKYKGKYLLNCVQRCKNLQQDSICYLYLLSNVIRFYIKTAFLYNYSIIFDTDNLSVSKQQESYNRSLQINLDEMTKIVDSKSDNRKNSSHTGHSSQTNSKRAKILKYYSMISGAGVQDVHLNSSNESSGRGSYYSSLASSIASVFYGRGTNDQQKHLNKSIQIEDIDLLRIILASVTSNNYTTTSGFNDSNSSGSNSTGNNTNTTHSNFDMCDLNIVIYLLKSLKVKQIYLYNLAMHKRYLRNMRKQRRIESIQNTNGTNIPLIQVTDHLLCTVNNTELDSKHNEDNPVGYASSNTNLSHKNVNDSDSNFIDDVQYPLLVEYEEMTLFNSKKN